ncbi:MAG: CHASE domain-containing protein [Deltaproteobacteria bacterium]
MAWLTLAVFALSLSGASAVGWYAVAGVRREVHGYFDFRVRDANERIASRMRAYEMALLGTRGLFDASSRVERDGFRRFVESLGLGRQFPGIQGVGFAVALPATALDAHVAAVRAEGFAGYAVRPPGARETYTAIVFLEPFRDRNLRAFGYDMYSEPVRRRAMERARDLGETAVSGKVTLVQETAVSPQAGFLMYVPVYRAGAATDTIEARRGALVGWAYAPFRVSDLMRGVLGELAADLDLEIYDGGRASPESMLYDSFGSPGTALRAPLHTTRHLYLGGNVWTLVAGGRPGLEARIGGGHAPIVALLVVMASALVTLLSWTLGSSRGRAVASLRDRETELRRLAQVQTTILDNANVGITYVRDRVVVWANHKMAEMFGYTTAGIMSQSTRTFYPSDESHEQLGREAYPRLAAGAVYESEREMVRSDGSRLWAHLYGKAVEGDQTNAGSIWVFDDVTTERAAKTELASQRAELEALNTDLEARVSRSVEAIREKDAVMVAQGRMAAMGEMIGNIAHQWRQPLNALGLVVANLADAHSLGELDAATLDRLVADANRFIQKMSTTIGDFLSFFLPDKQKRAFSALEQVRAAMVLVRAGCDARGIVFELVAPADVSLWGFPNEYSQVLLNLLVNARDAIAASVAVGGTIRIEVTVTDGQGCVTVGDTGGGIAPGVMDRVFEPYFSTKPGGTGIGLYMSKTIIEQHMGGRLTAHNAAGGAEFRVVTPCAAAS